MATKPHGLLLGVDAGGTSCRARLADRNGRLLGEGKAGPANAFYDPKGSWQSILSATRMAFAQAGIDFAESRYAAACLGVAGLDPLNPQAPPTWPLDVFLSCVVETDALVALRGAHAGEDGAVLVVGTGSVGLAVVGSRRLSVGGYGTILSDEGSGGWLGREATRRMLWSIDGRLPWSSLARKIQAVLGDQHAVVKWGQTATAADFARLAPIVLAAAHDGDETATMLIRQGATLLNLIVSRLAEVGAERISVLGGLAVSIAPWLDFGNFAVVPAKGDALDGAILLAAGTSSR